DSMGRITRQRDTPLSRSQAGIGDGTRLGAEPTQLYEPLLVFPVRVRRVQQGSALRRMEGSIMRSKLSPRFGVALATLLFLWSGSLGSIAHAAAPVVTFIGLRVNGVNMACGAMVHTGDQVCVRFQTDQPANAMVTIQKDAGPIVTIAS